MKTSFSRSSLSWTIALAAIAMLAGCVSTPQRRIEANPAIYDSLNSSERGLVSRGRITEGMSTNAVFLAWGSPDLVKTSSDGGRITETWLYQGSQPVYDSYSTFGYGYGYPRHYGYGYDPYCPSYHYAPRVYYQSYIAGKVTFRNKRVVQWETQN